jgi:cysteine desulfurase
VIYLDNHATTPCDPRVVEAMLPFFTSQCANAAIGLHSMGRETNKAVDHARAQVATLMGCQSADIVFTSGATESNNLVLFGVTHAGTRRKIVTTAIEHKSVLAPCDILEKRGFTVIRLPVDKGGRVSVEAARTAVDEETLLVSVQAANNEVGTIQDLSCFAEIAHAKGALFHSDAAQAFGKIPLNVETFGIDLLSVSAHKIYGPKGVGALYVRRAVRRQLTPLMYGGSQEEGLRPGTTAVPLCVGFGMACKIANAGLERESARIGSLRDKLQNMLLNGLPGSRVNGDPQHRLSTNISLTIPGVDGESLALALQNVALSTGAACNSGAQEPSYVLRALGMDWNDAHCTIRIGLGRFNTTVDIENACAEIVATAKRLGAASQL